MSKFAFCVVKFDDESRARVAPIELVRLVDQSEYKPTASDDVPDAVEVKWEKSLASGSFSTDGYYPAKPLLNSATLKSALAKVKERNIKIHSSPLISLPSPKDSPTARKHRKRSSGMVSGKSTASEEKGGSKKPCKDSFKVRHGKSEEQDISNTGKKDVEKHDKKSSESINGNLDDPANISVNVTQQQPVKLLADDLADNDGDCDDHEKKIFKKNFKVNTAARNSMERKRLEQILTESITNPLFSLMDDIKAVEAPEKEDDDDLNSTVELKDDGPGDIKSISSSSSQDGEVTSSDSDDDDDPLYKCLDENDGLKKRISQLEDELKAQKDLTVTANNLKVNYKKKSEDIQKELHNSLSENNVLKKRNTALQEAIVKLSSGSSWKPERTGAKQSKTNLWNISNSPVKELKSTADHSLHTPEEESGMKCKLVADNSPHNSSKKSSTKPKSKKRDHADIDNEEINLVSQKIKSHLMQEKCLVADEKNQVNIVHGVKWDQKVLDDIVQNCTDVSKSARNLVTHTWTMQERSERSLDGLKSNRFPNCKPKKKATPRKVNAILGAVKGVLEFGGDPPQSEKILKKLTLCRKAIGSRLAYDGLQSKQ